VTANAAPVQKPAVIKQTVVSPARQFYWCVRRELWENRSIYVSPALVGVLIMLASGISAFLLPGTLTALDPAQQHEIIEQPYMLASLLLMLTTLLVAFFYCLEAFQGERRDRSILFWKSMPVSDLITVAGKASIPLLVLPVIAFAATFATQAVMFVLGTLRMSMGGSGVTAIGQHVPLLRMWPMLFYHLVAGHGFWYAPFYGWLLLVSAWARRVPLLWATLPLIVLALIEKIAFSTSFVMSLLLSRFVGAPASGGPAANPMAMESLVPATPMQFLASPAFWLGLSFFALCLAAAVRLRRLRGPA